MAVILAHIADPSLVDYQHYVWANMFQFLGAQVATIPLTSVCSTDTLEHEIIHYIKFSSFSWGRMNLFKFNVVKLER